MSNPLDEEPWKHFNGIYPKFVIDLRNVSHGFCANSFILYSQFTSPYSCWPMIVIPYNLPLEMYMITSYMLIILIIPSQHNPKKNIIIVLQPLIDELKTFWEIGGAYIWYFYNIELLDEDNVVVNYHWFLNVWNVIRLEHGWKVSMVKVYRFIKSLRIEECEKKILSLMFTTCLSLIIIHLEGKRISFFIKWAENSRPT